MAPQNGATPARAPEASRIREMNPVWVEMLTEAGLTDEAIDSVAGLAAQYPELPWRMLAGVFDD